MEQLNVNLLVQEYEGTINSLLVENIRMKTYIKQIEMMAREAEAQHDAPPAPPSHENTFVEDVPAEDAQA